MKKLILLSFAASLTVSLLAGEKIKVDPERYPITGLTSLELRRVLSAASTNVVDGVTISSVFVHKSSVSIGTIATYDGKAVASDSFVLKSNGQTWTLNEKTEPEHKTLKAGIPPDDLISFVRTLPLGPKILFVVVKSENKLTVCTGHVSGPLAGRGKYLTYEKQDGKWEKTKETMWIS